MEVGKNIRRVLGTMYYITYIVLSDREALEEFLVVQSTIRHYRDLLYHELEK